MARSAKQKKGVFCLETHSWAGDKDETSVEPLLELLHKMNGYQLSYLRRDVATRAEFEHFLERYFTSTYDTYPILHLSFHGKDNPPGIVIGDSTNKTLITLNELAELIDGRCQRRVIYFGSCNTMNEHGKRLKSFLKSTGALAVCGFKETVYWLPSAALEILILGGLQEVSFTKQGLGKFARVLKEEAPGLHKKLGFRLVT